MRMLHSLTLAACVCALAGGCAGSGARTGGAPTPRLSDYPLSPKGKPAGASAFAHATARALAPGINFGNMLEAPREGDYGVTFRPEYLDLVSGFHSVRLPVRWSNHALAEPPFTVDSAFMDRVASIVDPLLDRGQYVILDMENYSQLDDIALEPGEGGVPRQLVRPRFVAIWQQVAEHFADRSDHLLFELYGRPYGRGRLRPTVWRDLASRTLAVVRRSNPDRLVLLSPDALELLRLPNDSSLIASVDLSQRAWPPNLFWRAQGPVRSWGNFPVLPLGALSWADTWSRRYRYPVFLAGFGEDAPMLPRLQARTADVIREAAERYGIGWAYWDLDSTFDLSEPGRGANTQLLRALLPPK